MIKNYATPNNVSSLSLSRSTLYVLLWYTVLYDICVWYNIITTTYIPCGKSRRNRKKEFNNNNKKKKFPPPKKILDRDELLAVTYTHVYILYSRLVVNSFSLNPPPSVKHYRSNYKCVLTSRLRRRRWRPCKVPPSLLLNSLESTFFF